MKHLPPKSDGIANKDGRLYAYLNELGKDQYEPLSREKERVVIDLYLQKDISARDILIKRNLRYVMYVAKVYQNSWYSLSDLVSSGNIGLIKGVEKLPFKFDPQKYTRLVNFLSPYIQGAIINFLYENGNPIRLPHLVISMCKTIKRMQEKFLQEHNREIPDSVLAEEVASCTKFSEEAVYEFLSHPNVFISTSEAKQGRPDSETLTIREEMYENIVPCDSSDYSDHFLLRESLGEELAWIFRSALSPREGEILTAWFNLDHRGELTVEDICEKYDLTRERVRQIKERAIKRLQRISASKLLRGYL